MVWNKTVIFNNYYFTQECTLKLNEFRSELQICKLDSVCTVSLPLLDYKKSKIGGFTWMQGPQVQGVGKLQHSTGESSCVGNNIEWLWYYLD